MSALLARMLNRTQPVSMPSLSANYVGLVTYQTSTGTVTERFSGNSRDIVGSAINARMYKLARYGNVAETNRTIVAVA
jgi:hypothetical protein